MRYLQPLMTVLVGMVFMVGGQSAQAHKPSYADDHSSIDKAFKVEDPEISIVLYSQMTCSKNALWMQMDSTGLDEVWLELGVPKIDRLADYRPSLAIVAEGLPDADVPFEVPDGMGVHIIHTDDVEVPIDFSEPFTQTDSWILFRDWFDVPSDTDVYLVAYNPAELTGKLWVAVGLIEDFSGEDMSEFPEWLQKTQEFHEVGDTEDHVELDCAQIYEEDQPYERPQTAEVGAGGCSTASFSKVNTLSWIFGLALLGYRRRRA